MDNDRLIILIPAYNEEQTIRDVIKGLRNYGTILVIDDCSTDNTNKIAKEQGAKVFKNEKNLGYEASLRIGFKKAYTLGAKFVITFDADNQHDPSMVPVYYNLMKFEGYDLILGVRPKKARISEQIMGVYFQYKFGIKDILCGMKGYNIDLWKDNNMLFSSFESIGTELTMISMLKGAKMKQVSIPIRQREDKPRFGNLIKANYKIFKSLFNVINLQSNKGES